MDDGFAGRRPKAEGSVNGLRIEALLFDLDGTLLDSEPLKNEAHARAVLELAPHAIVAQDVVEVVTRLIGTPTPETAIELVRRFGLEDAARERMPGLGLAAPWEVYSHLQLEQYQRILDEPGVLERAQLPHAVELLRQARRLRCRTGLGSMSYRREVWRTLNTLGWTDLLDIVLAGDEVSRGKPDPEIYLRIAAGLGVLPGQCLVIEDSVSGIGAALAAGMHCIAVPNDLTRASVTSMIALDKRWIVQDPRRLSAVVRDKLGI